jgi:radical SAM protein with 4Fe4S-binding SPASM domain
MSLGMSLGLCLPLGMSLGLCLLLCRGLLMRPEHEAALARIDSFVDGTRSAIFVRRADNLLMIRPDKTLQLNDTAVAILAGLYNRERRGAAEVLPELATQLGATPERLLEDAGKLVQATAALLNEEISPDTPALRFGTFDRSVVKYPTLAEIALTYGCQNRCAFCYASSPHREGEHRQMSTGQVQLVMDRIFHEAHVPSLSFTGGEATLRRDLPELISYGHQLGFRVNLISNGIRLADDSYARSLVAAGLDSAQISLEAGSAELHDAIVGRGGAFTATVAGVRNLQQLGIHVHTNSTLCPQNLHAAGDLIRFVARDLGLKTLSMNMVIRTGVALGTMEISYSQVAECLPGLLEIARAEGIRLVWYSPIPYCIFNPVLANLGAKSCACVDGILSVDPSGQVLPCSSFADGIGSLLEQPFARIYHSRAANYWRRKMFSPPVCRSCPDLDVCAGGCPLYWDAAGSFAELPVADADNPRRQRRWQRQRKRGRSFGVPAPRTETATVAPREVS